MPGFKTCTYFYRIYQDYRENLISALSFINNVQSNLTLCLANSWKFADVKATQLRLKILICKKGSKPKLLMAQLGGKG